MIKILALLATVAPIANGSGNNNNRSTNRPEKGRPYSGKPQYTLRMVSKKDLPKDLPKEFLEKLPRTGVYAVTVPKELRDSKSAARLAALEQLIIRNISHQKDIERQLKIMEEEDKAFEENYDFPNETSNSSDGSVHSSDELSFSDSDDSWRTRAVKVGDLVKINKACDDKWNAIFGLGYAYGPDAVIGKVSEIRSWEHHFPPTASPADIKEHEAGPSVPGLGGEDFEGIPFEEIQEKCKNSQFVPTVVVELDRRHWSKLDQNSEQSIVAFLHDIEHYRF